MPDTFTRDECLRDECAYRIASFAREIRLKTEALIQRQLMNDAATDSSESLVALAVTQVMEDHLMLLQADEIRHLPETP